MAAGDITLVSSGGLKPQAPFVVDVIDVEGLASYVSGGLKLNLTDPAAIKLLQGRSIQSSWVEVAEGNADAKWGRYDIATDKLLFITAALVEVAGAVDLTGQVLRLTVLSE